MRWLFTIFLLVSGSVGFAQTDHQYVLTEVASGFESPVLVVAAPLDARLFVVQQNGVISVLQDGAARQVLDIRARVNHRGEAGLLGLALHPEFLTNGLAYISYTTGRLVSVIEEIRYDFASGQFDPDPVRPIYQLRQPARNHNGGMVAFGPAGYLYAGFGDGGGSNDRYRNGQNFDTELGTIIRLKIEPDRVVVPIDNPNPDGPAPLAWAYGLRNPWRFSIDGDLMYIGDVGQSGSEEVNVISTTSSGLNLGWPDAEGTQCSANPDCQSKDFVWPVETYPTRQGCAVTGGYVYRGAMMPELAGTYFYGDYCNGRISSFRFENGQATAQRTWADELPKVDDLSGFGLDGFGELYVTSLNGAIYRLERAGG